MTTRNPNQILAAIRQVVGTALRCWAAPCVGRRDAPGVGCFAAPWVGRALLGGVILGCGAVVSSGSALAQFQGVQPIFNNQLGGWTGGSQTPPGLGNRPGTRPPGSVTLPIPIYPPYFRPGWPYPYGYYPYYGYGYSYTYPQYSAPVVVVQPQIVQVPVFVPVAPQANAVVGAAPAAPMPLAAPRKILPRANPLQPVEEEILRRVTALKPSDEAGRTKADQAIVEGDREFAAGEYRRAMFKYRDATRRAADYAPAYFRSGHVHAVLGDYELAVSDFGMALEIARTIDAEGFSFDAFYRDDAAALQEHLATLGGAIRRQPEDGGLHFLMGVMLHYGGNPLQAQEYFARALELPGRHRPYAAMYLPEPAPAAAPPPAAK